MNRAHDDQFGSGWDMFMKDLLKKISGLKTAMDRDDLWQTFYLSMRLCCVGVPKVPSLSNLLPHRWYHETDGSSGRNCLCGARSRRQVIYDKVAANIDMGINIVFLAYLWGKGEFDSIHPISEN